MSKDNQLFFTQFPSFFLMVPMLDILDRDILLRIMSSYNQTMSTPIEELAFLSGSGKRSVSKSLQKLCFMKLIIRKNTTMHNGHNGTPVYSYNENRNSWVLTNQVRKLLNNIESERQIEISSGENDLDIISIWYLKFEQTLHILQRQYFDENDEAVNTKKISITRFAKNWNNYLSRILGENKPVLTTKKDGLKRLASIVAKNPFN